MKSFSYEPRFVARRYSSPCRRPFRAPTSGATRRAVLGVDIGDGPAASCGRLNAGEVPFREERCRVFGVPLQDARREQRRAVVARGLVTGSD